jgi:hypothetical protein
MRDITVGELIAMLSDMPEDAPVRVAHQPSYPMQFHLSRELALRSSGDIPAGGKVVYLLDAGQPSMAPYAPAGLFEGQLEDEDEEAEA